MASQPAPFRVSITDGLTASYEEIYKAQPQVRTVVSFIARNVADLGLHTYRRVSDTDRERVTDHPLPALLAQPVPGVRTAYRWMEQLVSDVCIYDLHYAVKVRAQGRVVALLRVSPSWVTPKGGSWFAPAAYEVKGSRGKLTVRREDMLVVHGYNPTDDNAGMPPIEALRQQLMEEYAAAKYRKGLWDSGARISGVIKRPVGAPWGDGPRSRFLAEWRQLYSGVEGGMTGGTPLLEDGMEFQALSFSAKDAQYIDSRKLTREEAAAAYHVPPPMVGILDHATFSNITEQHKHLYQDTLGPWLTMIQQELQMQLVPEFGDSDGLYLEFNLSQKLRGSLEEQGQQLQTAVGGPWLTRNEARARQNLPALDGGDELITPLNVTTGGQASPSDSAPPPKSVRMKARPVGQDLSAEAALRRFFERQAAAVLSALGAGQSLAQAWDAQRWDVELAADLLGVNVAVAQAAADEVLAAVAGATYDAGRTEAWLAANAAGVAAGINAGTLAEIAGAGGAVLDAARAAFERARGERAVSLAAEQVTSISGFATQEVAQQSGRKATKTWLAGSGARSSHSKMAGQTVPVGQMFSNGARWPGDSLLPVQERANCRCAMSITFEEG